MRDVRKLVSRTPPPGLADWAAEHFPGLDRDALLIETVWAEDWSLECVLDEWAAGRKVRAIRATCSVCGESTMLWRAQDGYGTYGFVQDWDTDGPGTLCADGDETTCPICGAKVVVKTKSKLRGKGYFVAAEQMVMSASVVGEEHLLALTCWAAERRIYANARRALTFIPAEAYVFSPHDCAQLMGWRNAYSGTAGYFIQYDRAWRQPQDWRDRWGEERLIFSVTDNLSQSIVGMKNSLTSFRGDITQLQKNLDTLTNTKFQLKNFDLKDARQELERARKAFEDLGEAATDADREAARADFQQANQHYENVRQQLDLVSKQARQTEKDMLNATSAISKADNRATKSTGGTGSILTALGVAGLGQMAGDTVMDVANTLIGSAFGQEIGGLVSSGLSGAVQGAALGAALGTVVPGIGNVVGTAVGAAAGGALGLLQGGNQAFEARDDYFKSYVQQQYDAVTQAQAEALSSGSGVAAQREMDAIAFNQLLGAGIGDQYLSDLRVLAASTPMEYSDLTSMSRALATGFGDNPEQMLELMQAIGDAGSAVGVDASGMTEMARALSRMQSSGKATLEYLQIFQDRGVDVIGMLSDGLGKTQGEIYEMISKGKIQGVEAVKIIQSAMEEMYDGAMEKQSQTFSGLSSTLEDARTELDNAMGEGYNDTRKQGLQEEIDYLSGQTGEKMQEAYRMMGEWQASLENQKDELVRDAMSAVMENYIPETYLSSENRGRLEELADEYQAALQDYESGSQEAGAEMGRILAEAQVIAANEYNASEGAQLAAQSAQSLAENIRDDSAVNSSYWDAGYALAEQFSTGIAAGIRSRGSKEAAGAATAVADRLAAGLYTPSIGTTRTTGTSTPTIGGIEITPWPGHAAGLGRVPYNNYAALLHEGERVLTASQAREQDTAWAPISINIAGSWQVRQDSDIDAIAEALADKIGLAIQGGVR